MSNITARTQWVRAMVALALVILMATLYWLFHRSGALAVFTDQSALHDLVSQLGVWGPVAIIGLMVAAIVMSPIPSGPVAMVAGALYGPVLGTTYVVIGAEAGALLAFGLSRIFGYDLVRRWARVRPLLTWLARERSQTGLMIFVFASRLIPFISFDAVSYAAGLTPLAFWRFLVATLVGVIPMAYLIARFGEVMITSSSTGLTIALILISGMTLLPILVKLRKL